METVVDSHVGVSDDNAMARAVLGTAAMALGALLLLLTFMDQAGGVPFDLPRFWYVNRTLWAFLGFALIPAGMALLKHRPGRTPAASWQPSEPGVRFQRVVVYSREDCHLCDDAKAILGEYAEFLPRVEDVDIDRDPELRERFGTSIPVVECDGKIRFKGQVDELLLRRLIEGTPPVG
jgi:glutaredoxin